ncbi:hypothetical protein L3Q82_002000 [Scortum barcoo]|uniref:Uncharacterized protein n=1 Tax=Scortum barcoo TaxID=214431 RepID=A0ACB8W1P2_9TELE|nr:hypothetical protein L3Q82_002000 [Scortum barcoo]
MSGLNDRIKDQLVPHALPEDFKDLEARIDIRLQERELEHRRGAPGAPIPKARLYSISGPERKAMDDYIEASLRPGIIRPSSLPAGAGFFFVGKKDSSLRLCIDYSALNDITVKNRHPLPLISSTFEQLQQAKIFTKLDLRNAYHLHQVRQVLVCLLENQLYVKAEKCEFHASSVSFLGFIVSENQVRMDPEKFIRNFSTVAALLLKEMFTSTPVLTMLDPQLQFIVEVDASNEGVGAVLSQRSPKDHRIHPCAFLS